MALTIRQNVDNFAVISGQAISRDIVFCKNDSVHETVHERAILLTGVGMHQTQQFNRRNQP
jgi:hypothetical protein